MPSKENTEQTKNLRPKPTTSSQQVTRAEHETLDARCHVSRLFTGKSSLCSNCLKLDLEAKFGKGTNSTGISLLANYHHPSCPFCTIVRNATKSHWGSASPIDDTNSRPRLYLQSKEWCSFGDRGQTHRDYRIALAITQQPPDYWLNRPVLWIDEPNRFILTELELLAKPASEASEGGERPSLRRTIKPHLNLKLISRWLEDCQSHEKCKARLFAHGMFLGGFRLIDVFEARLVEKTEPCEYFALSYVWGNRDPSRLQTTKQNLSLLKQPSALTTDGGMTGKRLPRTIADVMELCRGVGQRYLWVDSLCIIQDDLQEKMRLIHGMDRVYENASLTIFAVSGRHADARLPGIGRRRGLWRERVHTIETRASIIAIATARISLEEHIRSSYWYTRGWTYQEQALSERRLYFTSDEVFFRCPQCTRREGYAEEEFEICTSRTGPPLWGRSSVPTALDLSASVPRLDDATTFSRHVLFRLSISDYTRRNLSYPEDVLNAFAGVYPRFTSKTLPEPGIVAVQGIPLSLMPQSLLWFVPESRITSARRDEAHGIKLSSWSWASRTAPIDFVCLISSNFPAPDELNFHAHAGYSFVSEWYLSFKDGAEVRKVEIPGGQWRVTQAEDADWFKPDDLLALSILRSRPQPCSTTAVAGMLEFMAPCIAYSYIFERIYDETLATDEWLLIFPEIDRRCCFIKFDSDCEQFTDFVLVFHDGTYVALCVKTVDGISRRVGVATLLAYRTVWSIAVGRGLLDIQWKHIRLC